MFVGMGANSGGAYNLESSLRFRGGQNLTRTITSASNRRTYTQSVWLKRGAIGTSPYIFNQFLDGNTNSLWYFNASSSEAFNVFNRIGGTNYQVQTSASFRDTSAWYHIVVATDTTQSTASNRVKIWINGEQVTSFSSTGYPPQNSDTAINSASTYYIGSGYAPSQYFDGYITEYNFVDGQALTADDFGETDDTTGVWKPKEYTGTYGTNGFYLPMKETQQATGFNTVLWAGNGTSQSITGVGFEPDLVWIKNRSFANSNQFVDSVRGATKHVFSNTTDQEFTYANGLTSFNTDGFSIGNLNDVNNASYNYVAWCWDAGSSTVSNTDGDITTSVRANPATGFSIATFTGNGLTAQTIGHGLSQPTELYIWKRRNSTEDWGVETTAIDGTADFLYLNKTDAKVDSGTAGQYLPTSTTQYISFAGAGLNSNGGTYVCYSFHSVAGYSKIGSYTGNGSTSGPTVTTGFRPAFVMIKRTDAANSWVLFDNVRDVDNFVSKNLVANTVAVEFEGTSANAAITFTDTGFQLVGTGIAANASGGTYIYMAFADTRDAQFNFDASGNKNNWTANNINSNASSETTYDIMNDVATLTDEDTGNFATLNPLASNSVSTLSNANLDVTSSTVNYNERATIELPSSGKWYFESYLHTVDSVMGVMKSSIANNVYMGFTTDAWIFVAVNGNKANGSQVSYDSSSVVGQTIGIAMNMDNGELTFYRNGVSLGVAFTIADTSNLVFGIGQSTNASRTVNANFGQRPFKYTPPTGYKKLNTYNLPDSTIQDGSQYMNPVTYTGNGDNTGRAITGVGFSPDFVWVKDRTSGNTHILQDTIRGAGKCLFSAGTGAESSTSGDLIQSFDSDGFTVNTTFLGNTNNLSTNGSGLNYVAWNWRASDSSPVSNTDGTITSTVSANTDSGFSVVTYTGTAAVATVGHGLGVAPSMIITKNRDTTTAWWVYHAALGNTKYMVLNTTDAAATSSVAWNNTSPTSTVFTLGGAGNPSNANQDVAYCFAEVEGFSKFGSYTGNGSTDGPFVYTGFRPAFIMTKCSSSGGEWEMYDTSRGSYNAVTSTLEAQSSTSELNYYTIDILSNGFKQRNYYNTQNQSGATFIYMAFAEHPFKQSLAR